MALEQRLEQSQRLMLTQTMLQSLELLQLTSPQLEAYLQEEALSNPMLCVEGGGLSGTESMEVLQEREYTQLFRAPSTGTAGEPVMDHTAAFTKPQSFTDYLKEQLGQMKLLDKETLARCVFLVDSLNSSGYLDCPLDELAQLAQESVFDMEQALFVVQALEPTGVGARNLSECLLLQLAQSRYFSELNVRLVCSGLPLLAKKDLRGLCALLHAPMEAVQQAIDIVCRLNPIPSQGFFTGDEGTAIRPEALIRCEDGRVVVEMNDRLLPQVQLDPTYCAMLRQENGEVHDYLSQKQAQAKALLENLEHRTQTIARVLCAVVQVQEQYFLCGAQLKPLTMQQLADQLEVSSSTVSRAIKGKYVQFGASVFPIRELLSAPLPTAAGEASVQAVKGQLRRFISAENPHAPLSDETLAQALRGAGIFISRRTVAKYRGQMEIPPASQRRVRRCQKVTRPLF